MKQPEGSAFPARFPDKRRKNPLHTIKCRGFSVPWQRDGFCPKEALNLFFVFKIPLDGVKAPCHDCQFFRLQDFDD